MNRAFDLSYWINERYAIKLRKEAGEPYPWTPDPAMSVPRYCNVHREDDKVTKWLAENWRPYYQEVWHYLLARLINNVPTLERLEGLLEEAQREGERGWLLENIRIALKVWRTDGPIFGNAYTVSTSGLSMDKVDYVIDRVLKPALGFELELDGLGELSLAQADRQLQWLTGVSSFMSGQLIADMKNTREHQLAYAADWHTWAAPGPGSLRGLSWYFHGQPTGVTETQFDKKIGQCYDEIRPLIANYIPDIHMQDFQNCLCEFSKYMKFKSGDRHVRNRYRPG